MFIHWRDNEYRGRSDQCLPQIFGPGHYLVLDHINSLPNKLPEIYLRLRR